MVTVTDEILQESSQFIRFYLMSHRSYYFKVMRFLKLLYLLIYYCAKALCHKIYRISQTFIFSKRSFHLHSRQLMKARLDKIKVV